MTERFGGGRMQQRYLPTVLIDRFARGMDVAAQRHVCGVSACCNQFVGDDVGSETFADPAEINRQLWVESHPVVRDLQSGKDGHRTCSDGALGMDLLVD